MTSKATALQSRYINSVTVGFLSGAVVVVGLVHEVSQMVRICQDLVASFCVDEADVEEERLKKERYVTTKEWLVSEEHENAVLVNLKRVSISPDQALKKLRHLYPFKTDILGVRIIDGAWLNITFANRDLMDTAMLNGVSLDSRTTVYPTKTLNAAYQHTLLTIKGLPICSMETTRQKIDESLVPLFDHALVNPLVDRQEWPPVVLDYVFHQRPIGFYSGTVTIILRGRTHLFEHTLHLNEFGANFKCKLEHAAQYCHHCHEWNHHQASQCPKVASLY